MIFRKLCFGIAFAAALSGGTICAMADTELKSVTVSNSMPNWESGAVRVPEFLSPRGCDLEVEWISSDSSFVPGKTATARITLTAEDGYWFSNNASFTVKGATVSSKSISGDKITARISVGPLYYKLGTPEQIAWSSEKSSIVKWSAVKYATQYRVKVYHDDKVVKQETVKTKSYDAGKYFNGEGDVYVSVTALGTGSSNSQYLRQGDEAFVDGSDIDWQDKETTYGYWEGKRYRISEVGDDKVYAKGWIEIFGKWYYFDDNGNLKTGWIEDGGRRYYSNSEGAMQTGWVKPDENAGWYYLCSSGEMETGWIAASAPGIWYYSGSDGMRKTGWLFDDQRWYFMGTDGKMQKGWQSINNCWYYFGEDGHMAAGETIDAYYVNGDGVWIP